MVIIGDKHQKHLKTSTEDQLHWHRTPSRGCCKDLELTPGTAQQRNCLINNRGGKDGGRGLNEVSTGNKNVTKNMERLRDKKQRCEDAH